VNFNVSGILVYVHDKATAVPLCMPTCLATRGCALCHEHESVLGDDTQRWTIVSLILMCREDASDLCAKAYQI
jgi:hypothetical protein